MGDFDKVLVIADQGAVYRELGGGVGLQNIFFGWIPELEVGNGGEVFVVEGGDLSLMIQSSGGNDRIKAG